MEAQSRQLYVSGNLRVIALHHVVLGNERNIDKLNILCALSKKEYL